MNRLLKCSFLSLLVIQTMATFTTNGRREQPLNCEDTEQGSPFLWTLPGREPPVYFFGTIHVPYTLVWGHVPWLAKRSFERADSVFFELDLTDPETVAQLSSCQMLPSGKTLADILPEDMYKRLKGHLDYVKLMIPSWMQDEHRGLYSEYLFKAITGNWEKKRPVWVMLMINSLTESDIRSTGIPVLDLWLAREATRLGKRAGAVERVEEQCLPLNGLNGTQVLFALNQTLARLEELRSGRPSPFYGTEDLVRHYNCRNLSSASFANPDVLSDSGDASDELLSKNINQYFRQELIEKRNARMAHRVLQLLQQYPDESFFFAFGTGHFLGNGSVLDYIRDGGYEVEQVSLDAKIRKAMKFVFPPNPKLKRFFLSSSSMYCGFTDLSCHSPTMSAANLFRLANTSSSRFLFNHLKSTLTGASSCLCVGKTPPGVRTPPSAVDFPFIRGGTKQELNPLDGKGGCAPSVVKEEADW
ncbi:Metalloprotease TIKI2 like protein [Argiope bruennichi]|uniref:Metalloprotease TIKI homolog n=1 Tax=Argiope bruennichi TaxID=94029 RepID=A0A8T0FF77_ARGBR|nr:Metalloprotease TIKI2 like protein [Argiope bruennichi]